MNLLQLSLDSGHSFLTLTKTETRQIGRTLERIKSLLRNENNPDNDGTIMTESRL